MALCVIIHYDHGRRRSRFTPGATSAMVREAAVSETICPDCGERNARGAEFCGACGALPGLGRSEAEPEPARPAPPATRAGRHRVRTRSAPAVGAPARPPPGAGPRLSSRVRRLPSRPRPGESPAQASSQVAGQAAAQAWNAAAPVLGTQLPGALGSGRAGAGCADHARRRRRRALRCRRACRGADPGRNEGQPQQPPPGYAQPRSTAPVRSTAGAARTPAADRRSLPPLRCRQRSRTAVLPQVRAGAARSDPA